MPEGLSIDHKAPLNGLIPNYAEHVLICTGEKDWSSRIEEDNSGDNLAADLKELIGRGGVYSDPFHNISVLNSSFPSSISRRPEVQSTSVYLLPSFKYVPFLPRVSFDSVQALVKGYLLPEKLHPMNDGLSPIHKDRLLRKEAYQHLLQGVRDVDDVVVLICGHGGRDMRCGVLGPVLQAEFERQLPQAGLEVLQGPVLDESVYAPALSGTGGEVSSTARVGLISHVGGHKFAGNVIVYLPPTFKNNAANPHPLAGHGVWYGRIEPKHVECLIQETIIKGNIRRSESSNDDVINTSTFSAFTITAREQVSPTAFIISLRPGAWANEKGIRPGPGEQQDAEEGYVSNRIQDAWSHGLWSVEIKQPQLQIARHYTPLPPVPTPAGSPSMGENGPSGNGHTSGMQAIDNETSSIRRERGEQADLRILIRKMESGEMSTYLSRQRVGDTVWLRGSVDNSDRNDAANGDATSDQKSVIAHKLLNNTSSSNRKPYISILWANRRGADALGREQLPSSLEQPNSWFRSWGWRGSDASVDSQEIQAKAIQNLKRQHGPHFQISYFVDDEGSFIKAHDIKAALTATTSSTKSINCTWHSALAVEQLPDDNDAARSSSSSGATHASVARPGVNLLCAKRWHEGHEMQGPVRGLLGNMKREKPNTMDEWLVLKL
ncbi:Sucrase/ferredoxin-like-domain-containing protein [Xylariaceae sp. FL1651]|nr:Sucrase/ferredoxin-like-domain-containing protein [Xylariaceae sp. FL1651]